jgi:cytoskeletal protein RodZ
MPDEESVLGLTTIRRNRGITLEEISASTKISLRALDAIERGDFQVLPGGVYDTSYIRQYARSIDYDEGLILAAYHRAKPPAPAPPTGHGKSWLGSFWPASDTAS